MSASALARTLVLALLLTVAGSALAGAAGAKTPPKTAKLFMRGGASVKVNHWLRIESRFSPGTVTVKAGGKLSVRNKDEEPHTLSFVNRRDLPKKPAAIFGCDPEQNPNSICGVIAGWHEFDPATGEPGKPAVDVNAPGIDGKGDSWLVNPGQHETLDVSAKKGANLYFICAIHAWMQGRLQVR